MQVTCQRFALSCLAVPGSRSISGGDGALYASQAQNKQRAILCGPPKFILQAYATDLDMQYKRILYLTVA